MNAPNVISVSKVEKERGYTSNRLHTDSVPGIVPHISHVAFYLFFIVANYPETIKRRGLQEIKFLAFTL